jgi:predicted aldo/keto reductase-like oxidoreductase
MQYRRFGKTELKLPVLSLGGMRYPHTWQGERDDLGDDSLEAAYRTTKQALEVGINHIETAKGYGKSENLYGAILPKLNVKREDLIITTKGGPVDSAGEMRENIEDSMKRLGVDYLDNFGIHGINNEERFHKTFRKNGALEAVRTMMKEGLIRHVGFSTHGPLEMILKAIETDEFESVNLHFYYFFQRNEPAVKLAAKEDMGIFIISPTDKGGQLFDPPESLKQLCSPLTPIAFNNRFCLSYPEITTLSVGAKDPKELDAHVLALKGGNPPTEEDRKIKTRLDGRSDLAEKEYCTYCEDCLPCPEKINIPETLRLRNLDVCYGMRGFGQYRYNMFRVDDNWFWGAFGDKCNDCNDCLSRCPEKLDIPSLVRDTHKRLFKPKEPTG